LASDARNDARNVEREGMNPPVILCVDDDPAHISAVRRALAPKYEVVAAESGAAALELLRSQERVDVVLSDLRMPEVSGDQLLEMAAQLRADSRRVIVTGFPEADELAASFDKGSVHHVLTKPWRPAELRFVIDQLLAARALSEENQRLQGDIEQTRQKLVEHELLLAPLDVRASGAAISVVTIGPTGHERSAAPHRDALTGLYTHHSFQERLREEVARASRSHQAMSLVLLDVDGFAEINYTLGYSAGDDILRRIASSLSQIDPITKNRSSDIVARYGGAEFVLLLPETGKPGALTKAARIRDAISLIEMPQMQDVSISIGVACFPDDAADAESLLTATEAAIRGAKRGGGGRIHFFSTAGSPDERSSRPFLRIREPELDRFRPYHERMSELTGFLRRERSLACLIIDLSHLRRVELDQGILRHTAIYDSAAVILDELRSSILSGGDLVCRTGDGDGYLVMLAPRREIIDLEQLGAAVGTAVENALAPATRELLREQPRVIVGSARVLGNSLLRPERLVNRLVTEAAESVRLSRARATSRDKTMLQNLILGDGLNAVYQPIVDLGTGDIFGYEALSRGPKRSMLESPATLFGVADEVDLTYELDRACFRNALRSAVGMSPVHRLFVNLLPMSFYDTTFIELEAGNLLSAAGLTPANIVFEITERLAIENFATFRRALASYTAMGFGVAIDDVGTRHANLETVMSLRPHFIKISDVLIRGVARSPVKREMLRSLGRIANAVDAVVVAEGIETIEDLVCLRDLGMRYAQGYYMARPAAPFPQLVPGVYETIRDLTLSPLGFSLEDDDDNGFEQSEVRVLRPSGLARSSGTVPVGEAGFAAESEANLIDRRDEEITNVSTSPLVRRARSSEPPSERKTWVPRIEHALDDDHDDDDEGGDDDESMRDRLRKRSGTENQVTDPAIPRPRGLN
jgi:diguanylate cyclase (GGDEF)-like protein